MVTLIRRIVGVLVVSGALLGSTAASARVLAISYFDNHTGDPNYDALGHGLAEMMITDLTAVSGVTVVERARLNDLLGELDLARSPFVDPATAAQMGKGLGAEWILTGSFATADPQMRIDARLVEVATAQVVDARSVTGPRDEFFLLQKELAAALIQALDIAPSARESARLGRVRTESFGAIVAWSQGLEALDRGALEQAQAALEASLAHDDRFDLALEALEQLRARMEQLGDRRTELKGQEDTVLLARLEALAADASGHQALAAELSAFAMARTPYTDASIVIDVTGRVLDLKLPDDLALNTGPFSGQQVNAWAIASYAQACYWIGRWTEFLTYAEQALQRYPTSPANAAITAVMGSVINQMQRETEGREREPMARLYARGTTLTYRCSNARGPGDKIALCRERVEVMLQTDKPFDVDWIGDWADAAERAGDGAEIERLRVFVVQHELPSKALKVVDEAASEIIERQQDVERFRQRYDAGNPDDVQLLARRQFRAGEFDRTHETLDAGLARWPDDLDLLLTRLDALAFVGDRDGAVFTAEVIRAMAGVQDDTLARVEDTVRGLDEWLAQERDMPAWELMQTSTELSLLGLHREAAPLFVQMSRQYPEYRTIPGPAALSRAAMESLIVRDAEGIRAAYEELIERFPDSPEAYQARAQLQTIPR